MHPDQYDNDDPDWAGGSSGKSTARSTFPLVRVLLIALCVLGALFMIAQFGMRGGAIAQTKAPQTQAGNSAQESAPTSTARAELSPIGSASSINVSAEGANTILEINLDRALPYRIFSLSSPSQRLVIDTGRVNFRFEGSGTGRAPGGGLITGVRFAQKSDTQSRFVLDLTGPVRVVAHELDGRLGGRLLRITLTASSAREFSQMAPIAAGRLPTAAITSTAPIPATAAPMRRNRYTVVIDPGHGGRDPGAIGQSRTFYEKHATLASGLLLRDFLSADPRFNVIMTRNTDVYLTLQQRIDLARDRRADLFISLHADAAPPEARVNGATVYTLSAEGSQRSRRLLNSENWNVVPESATSDSEVKEILNDLTRRDTTNQSSLFAQTLLTSLGRVGPLTRSSHRQAGFYVLLSPTVPAVLLEMGFMTDREDEARLQDPAFRARQMRATSQAIINYFESRPTSATTAPAGTK